MLSRFLIAASFVASVLASRRAHGGPHRVDVHHLPERKQCTVYANGNNASDVSNILYAFHVCGNGGRLVFPEGQNYFIDSKLNPVVNGVEIDWNGVWTFSPDIDYWTQPENHYPIEFQNHAASFILSGDGIHINGHNTGGIEGNGDVWYTADAGTTRPGRPMPFVFWNVSDVTVRNFFIKDPPLWAYNMMNATNVWMDNVSSNATSTQAPYGENWVQNTDGWDTMDAYNIKLTNLLFQGGDDCIAIKPRSYNVDVQNVTCVGGNGVAIGSLGQYLEDSSAENVVMDNVTVIRINEDLHNSAYIKTWTGVLTDQGTGQGAYESAGKPRGGGWGVVRNILFSNFHVYGADGGPSISQESGGNGSFPGSSLMEVSNVAFVNFTGFLSGDEKNGRTATVSCSGVWPCYGITYKNVDLTVAENSSDTGVAKCNYVREHGVWGLGQGCDS
ncbi:hypothetical protein MBLNU230_g6095t1 [Neophaeotheca triangularis]